MFRDIDYQLWLRLEPAMLWPRNTHEMNSNDKATGVCEEKASLVLWHPVPD